MDGWNDPDVTPDKPGEYPAALDPTDVSADVRRWWDGYGWSNPYFCTTPEVLNDSEKKKTMWSNTFRKALDARCALALSRILADKDRADDEELSAYENAHDLGWAAYHTGETISPLLAGEKVLLQGWEDGKSAAEAHEDNLSSQGTEDEWAALSFDEQREEWDEFHSLCAQGIADTMYFFDVLMSKHLVGYVGH